MGKKIALGSAMLDSTAIISNNPISLEERVIILQQQVEDLIKAFHIINGVNIKDSRRTEIHEIDTVNTNKDGIPIGISLMGSSINGGIRVLTVNSDGYYIGITKYESLSAAAEAVSGTKRSGWAYWKIPDGRTIKEAFRKR